MKKKLKTKLKDKEPKISVYPYPLFGNAYGDEELLETKVNMLTEFFNLKFDINSEYSRTNGEKIYYLVLDRKPHK